MTGTIKKALKSKQLGLVPEGYQLTNAGVLPSDWNSQPLSAIADEITETAGSQELETVSISAGIGFVNQAEKFGKELSGKQYEKYTVLHRGDFSYNKGNSKTYPQGCIYRLNDRMEAAVPNVFESFRIKDGNPDYYEQLFISGFLNRQLYSRINHGVRDDGLLNLTGKDFYSCEVPCPPLVEQQKIAEIFIQCDKVIELKRKRIEEEKKKKKWMICKLVSTPKESNSYRWVKLCDVSTILNGDRGKNYPSESEIMDGGIPFINAGHLVNNMICFDNMNYISEEKYLSMGGAKIQKGDILFCLRGSLGKFAIARFDSGALASSLSIIRANEAFILADYLFQVVGSPIFERMIKTENNGSSQPNLSAASVMQTGFLLPPLQTQKVISEQLDAEDTLINTLEVELAEYIRWKKALLQRLLTGATRFKV